MVKKKIIVFGASTLGEIAYNVLKSKYDICFFCDNAEEKWNKVFCGMTVIPPKQLNHYKEYDIIIASMYYGEISVQLSNIGLDSIYIFSYCDYNDKTYKKNYSLDKMCELNIYENISVNPRFKELFLNDFSLLYNDGIKDNLYLSRKDNDLNKYVLIISYIFPPIGGGGVQRTLKFVKYLREFGWMPIVITVGKDFHSEERDMSLENEIPDDIKVIRIDHKYFNSEHLLKKQVNEIVNLIYGLVDDNLISEIISRIQENNCINRQFIMTPDIHIGWVNSVLSKIEGLIDLKNINMIYTTSYPYSTHLVGFYLKRKYNIPWVADFRDEWTNHSYSKLVYKNDLLRYNVERKMEESILNECSTILNVTPLSKYNYINNFCIPESKIKVITNGYDESDFIGLSKTNTKKFTITHIGSMYINRLPNIILQCINNLIEEGYIDKTQIEIKLIGKIDLDIITNIKKIDKYDLIKILGYMEHKRGLNEGFNSSLLLLLIGEGEKFKLVYTGKVFEYLRLKCPILALSPKNSVVEVLLEGTRCGNNFEYNDFYNIKEYIKQTYLKWKNNEKIINPNMNQIEKYERKSLTKRLSDIFNELVKTK